MGEGVRSEKVLAISLFLIIAGSLIMYYSLVVNLIDLCFLGLIVTASGMLLTLLSSQQRSNS